LWQIEVVPSPKGAQEWTHDPLNRETCVGQELGVTPPLGFWDPLGFSKYDDPEVRRAGTVLGAKGQQKYSEYF